MLYEQRTNPPPLAEAMVVPKGVSYAMLWWSMRGSIDEQLERGFARIAQRAPAIIREDDA